MFKNYCRIAWRNLTKHKLFSFINIFGLASGMTVCMLAIVKIKDAHDYDTFHPNPEKSYRVITELNRKNGESFLCASSPLPLAHYLKTNYNIIDKSTSVLFSQHEITVDNKKLSAKEAFVDPDFYSIFGFTLLSGTPATRPQTSVLTAESAERFFGKRNPIGQMITIGKSTGFIVTGILAKPAFPSHLSFDLLTPTSAIPLIQDDNANQEWSNEAAAYTYVQIKEGVTEENLQNVLKNVTKQVNTIILPSGKNFGFDIQSLEKISPGTIPLYNITNEPILPNLVIFGLIGFSMLLLAFFNYVNLTLARSLDRAREVGIRKVAGALKQHLMLQFLSESVVVAILAFLLAYLQLRFISVLPAVSRIIGDAAEDPALWLYFVFFTLLTGLFAGWIPARVLSSFQPVRVLKGKFNTRLFGGVGLRKTLTVVQFATSLVAIVTLLIFYRQSVYMATADYGFTRERILNIEILQNSFEKTATAFLSVPGIEQVSGTSDLPGFFGGAGRFIRRDNIGDSLHAIYFSVTPSFVSNLGLQLVAGENLPSTSTEKEVPLVLINEEAARTLKFKNPFEAIGQLIWLNTNTKYRVAGVVKNFHHASFLRPIQPMLMAHQPGELRTVNLKVAKSSEATIIPTVETIWKKLFPNQTFKADWFDKQLYDQHLHKDDLVFIGLLTFMALSIACLGLLGMVVYTTKNREKEVGIRRVMGAKVSEVIVTISQEFVTLLLVSVCIGLPLGFIVGKQFLQQYTYRIPVNFGILAGSAATLLLLGGMTIGWQTYRTALTNPAKSLRTE